MRTICDVCENAPAILFCAADEAALCRSCDDKVHRCNKLASRHVRVGLADPSEVPHCDICENAPAFFYCEIDGSSLCLQCDMIVHVGGKRTHGRYLMLRQMVEFPGDKPTNVDEPASQSMEVVENHKDQNHVRNQMVNDKIQTNGASSVAILDASYDVGGNMNPKMIDLNARPRRFHGQASSVQAQVADGLNGKKNESVGVVPVVSFRRDDGEIKIVSFEFSCLKQISTFDDVQVRTFSIYRIFHVSLVPTSLLLLY